MSHSSRWKITQHERRVGHYTLRVWFNELIQTGTPWCTTLMIESDGHRAFASDLEKFGESNFHRSSVGAQDAVDNVTNRLGDPGALLALLRFFSAGRNHTRRQRAA